MDKTCVRLSELVTDIGILLQISECVGIPESPILLHMRENGGAKNTYNKHITHNTKNINYNKNLMRLIPRITFITRKTSITLGTKIK